MFAVTLQPMMVHRPPAPVRAVRAACISSCVRLLLSTTSSLRLSSAAAAPTTAATATTTTKQHDCACGKHAALVAAGGTGTVADRSSGGTIATCSHSHRSSQRCGRPRDPGIKRAPVRGTAQLSARRRRVCRQPLSQTHRPAAPSHGQARLQSIRRMRGHDEPHPRRQRAWEAVGHRPVPGMSLHSLLSSLKP